MLKFLSRIFNFSYFSKTQNKDSIIAVDFGSSSAKVLQLRRDKGRIVLETYGELSTGPYVGMSVGQAVNLGLDKMSEVLVDLFREANVTSKNGAMSIPLRSSLLISLDIPNLNKEDLNSAVPNEARRFIPVPISEVILDWWVVPEREDVSPAFSNDKLPVDGRKFQEVLIVAVHKDVVKIYQELSKKLSLNTNIYEIETFSFIRSVLTNDLSATVLVDFGAGTTKVSIVDYGVVRVSHSINKGSQDITVALSKSLNVSFEKAEEIKRKVGLVEVVDTNGEVRGIISPFVDYIFSEINRVIIDYQKKHSVAIEKVIISGGGSRLVGLLDLAKARLEMPVSIARPFNKMETPAFMEHTLDTAGSSFAVTIGLALRQLESLE